MRAYLTDNILWHKLNLVDLNLRLLDCTFCTSLDIMFWYETNRLYELYKHAYIKSQLLYIDLLYSGLTTFTINWDDNLIFDLENTCTGTFGNCQKSRQLTIIFDSRIAYLPWKKSVF
jgi:hypothetical protein